MSKTIFVIGASRGIGLETVRFLAQDSTHTIYCFARNLAQMAAVFGSFPNVRPFALDLSLPTVHQQLESVLAGVSRIDVLINNAGHIVVKPFSELHHDEIWTSYQVNVLGVMQTVQACLPKLVAGSHIVTISSMGGFQGSAKFPGLAAYSPSKAAVACLTELLAEELKPQGISINCLCLGAVQTEMLATAFPGYQAPLQAKEMGEFIGDFALTAHRFMNGKILPVSLSTP